MILIFVQQLVVCGGRTWWAYAEGANALSVPDIFSAYCQSSALLTSSLLSIQSVRDVSVHYWVVLWPARYFFFDNKVAFLVPKTDCVCLLAFECFPLLGAFATVVFVVVVVFGYAVNPDLQSLRRHFNNTICLTQYLVRDTFLTMNHSSIDNHQFWTMDNVWQPLVTIASQSIDRRWRQPMMLLG